jgi:hypothetical protein
VGISKDSASTGIREGSALVEGSFSVGVGEASTRGFSKRSRSIIDKRQQCSTAIIGSNMLL